MTTIIDDKVIRSSLLFYKMFGHDGWKEHVFFERTSFHLWNDILLGRHNTSCRFPYFIRVHLFHMLNRNVTFTTDNKTTVGFFYYSIRVYYTVILGSYIVAAGVHVLVRRNLL